MEIKAPKIQSLVPDKSPDPIIGSAVATGQTKDPTPPTQPTPNIPTNTNRVTSEEMNFWEACQAMMEGKRVRRLSWVDQDIYGCLHDTLLKLHEKNVLNAWGITDGDLTGTDWVTID